jgi:hypothetical protein
VLPSDILFYKPLVRGVDYWTEADQESIIQQVIAALGTPVFGRVDAENNIILSGALADGIYTIKYEDVEGNQTEIGTIEVGGVSYTNLADPTSEDWAVDKRLNSSAELADATGCQTTNFFPCVKGDVIRVKGLDIRYTNSEHTQSARAWFFDEGGTGIVGAYPASDSKIVFDGVDTFTITLDGLTNISGGHEEDVVKGRLSGMLFDGYTSEDIIITVNQEISDSNGDTGETYTNWIPLSTDENDNILNGVGYVEGYRINSSGALTEAAGVSTTGYIPCKNGDILRSSAGISGDNAGWTGIALYDANKTWLASIKQEVLATSSKWVVNDDGSFYLDTTAAPTAAYTFSFIRFHSQHIADEGAVITVNEKITAEKPSYTNVLATAINSDGSAYVGTNREKGYKVGYRLNSSGAESSAEENVFVTGFIPVAADDVVYLDGLQWPVESGVTACRAYLWLYDEGFGILSDGVKREVDTNQEYIITSGGAGKDENNNLLWFTISSNMFAGASFDASKVRYVRLSAYYIGEPPIITINEPID